MAPIADVPIGHCLTIMTVNTSEFARHHLGTVLTWSKVPNTVPCAWRGWPFSPSKHYRVNSLLSCHITEVEHKTELSTYPRSHRLSYTELQEFWHQTSLTPPPHPSTLDTGPSAVSEREMVQGYPEKTITIKPIKCMVPPWTRNLHSPPTHPPTHNQHPRKPFIMNLQK